MVLLPLLSDPDLNVMIEGDIEMAKSLGDFMGPDLGMCLMAPSHYLDQY